MLSKHKLEYIAYKRIPNDELWIYRENKRVGPHERSFDKQKWFVEIGNYLTTFKKKTGALPGSLVLASNIYLKNLYKLYFHGAPQKLY